MATKLTDKYLRGFISDHEYDGVAAEVKAAHKVLHDGSGLGNDFWAGSHFLLIMTRKSLHASRRLLKRLRKIPMCLSLSASAVLIWVQELRLNFDITELQSYLQGYTSDFLYG